MSSSSHSATAASSSDHSVLVSGSLAHLRFPNKPGSFALWKMKLIAHAESTDLIEALEVPLDPSDKVVRELLARRGGSEAYLALESDNDEDVSEESEPSLPASAGTDTKRPASPEEKLDSKKEEPTASRAGPKKILKKPRLTVAAKKEQATLRQHAAEKLASRVKKSRKMYSLLLTVLSDQQLQLVGHVTRGDAHGVWQVILARYERKTVASRHHTREKLHRIKMERGERFDQFLARLTDLQLRLQQMGSVVAEEEMLFVMLEGLPPAYELLVHTLRMKEDLTLEEAAEFCRDFQERKPNSNPREEATAHFAGADRRAGGGSNPARPQQDSRQNFRDRDGSQQQQQQQQQPPRPDRACTLCNQTNHLMFDCPKLPSTALKCSTCRIVGHSDSTCRRLAGRSSNERRRFGQSGRQNNRSGSDGQHLAAATTHDEDHNDRDDGFGDDHEDWSAFACAETALPASTEEEPHQALLAPSVPSGDSECAWQRGPPKIRGFALDSGATRHMTYQDHIMEHGVKRIAKTTIRMANGATVTMEKGGDVRMPVSDTNSSLLLRDVAYDPSLAANLLSVAKLVDSKSGTEVTFSATEARVHRRGVTLVKIPRQGNLYVWPHGASSDRNNACLTGKEQAYNVVSVPAVVVDPVAVPVAVPAIVHQGLGDFAAQRVPDPAPAAVPAQAPPQPRLQPVRAYVPKAAMDAALPAPTSAFRRLHERMCHIGRPALKAMVKGGAVLGLDSLKLRADGRDLNVALECEHCEYGKGHRTAFAKSRDASYKAQAIMGVWHADLSMVNNADSSLQEALGGHKYLSVVMDEYSHMLFVTPMKTKAETTDVLIQLHKRAVVDTGKPLKEFHSDGGGEYNSKKLIDYLKDKGVNVTSTTAHTPQHNPVERAQRTIFERARSATHHAGLPSTFWALAVTYSVYVTNRSLSKGSGDPTKTAHELWTGLRPSVKHLRPFGCDVFVTLPDVARGKMDAKKVKGIFVGIEEKKKGAYRCFVDGKVVVSRDCVFHESSFTASAALRSEIQLQEEAEENNRVSLQEEKQADNDGVGAAPTQPTRRAARAAAHRLYAPWSEESESQQMQRVLRASAEEEKKRLEREAQVQAAIAAAHALEPQTIDVAQEDKEDKVEEKSAEPIAVQEETMQQQAAEKAKKKTVSSAATPPPPRAALRQRKEIHYGSLAAVDAPLVVEPKTYADVLRSPQRVEWEAAMQEELQSLREHDTWDVVPLSAAAAAGRKPIGCKWVFKLKLHSDGSVERFKARLVAKGFTQLEGLDFFETFAPTLGYAAFRVLICDAAVNDLEVDQLDVKTAFLNGVMDATVFMKLPPGIDAAAVGGGGGEVGRGPACCRLKKALYGTKQASHLWHASIDSTLVRLGFRPCISEPCVYVKETRTGRRIKVGLFVDDLIPTYHTDDREEWNESKAALCATYEMKDLGEAVWVLAMKLTRDRAARSITLTQESYVEKMQHQFGLDDAKTYDTPEEQTKLSRADEATTEQQAEMQQRPYMELVGSLLYASISTRPDIAHAVAMLCRAMQNPGPAHWIAAKRVLRYLVGTKTKGLRFSPKGPEEHSNSEKSTQHAPMHAPSKPQANLPLAVVEAFCDADWAGDVDDRRSTSGCIVLLHGCAVLWLSKKQATVALSTAEAEYMAMSHLLKEVKWLIQLLQEMGVSVARPVPIFSDNQAAISISSASAVPASRTKHIDLRHHHVRECVRDGSIAIQWVAGSEQLADVFTKGISKQQYKKLTDRIMTKSQ